MEGRFPDEVWLQNFCQKLNSDGQYARIAQKWEGDLSFVIEAGGPIQSTIVLYMDLWHGACREARVVQEDEKKPAFVLSASYEVYEKVLSGELDPMQALLTRKLKVQGNYAYLMRNVPVILDFVRCAREVPQPE
ncbi:MAG: SCP2 sterol-binding domain-containing protein [Chloroflexota bacterium]